jgi:hypothetical protein
VATDGLLVEFAFDPKTVSHLTPIAGNVASDAAGHTLVSSVTPGIIVAIHVTDSSGEKIDIAVLNQTAADNLWRATTSSQETLILTDQALELTSRGVELTTSDSTNFSFIFTCGLAFQSNSHWNLHPIHRMQAVENSFRHYDAASSSWHHASNPER